MDSPKTKNMITGILWTITAIYLFAGFAFAIAFVTKGVQKVDEGAKGAGIGFRILIIPGTLVFWPLLLRKWLTAGKDKQHD